MWPFLEPYTAVRLHYCPPKHCFPALKGGHCFLPALSQAAWLLTLISMLTGSGTAGRQAAHLLVLQGPWLKHW